MEHLLAMSAGLIAATFLLYAVLLAIVCTPFLIGFLLITQHRLRTGTSAKSDAYRASQAALRERHAATLEATLQRNAIIQEEARQQYQSAAEAKRQARQQASAALDVPIVAYDRYGNPHVTTRRNQGLAAVLTVAFMIGAFVWIYHGGFMHQDCTTTLTTTGGINDSTMHDVTTCK